MYFFATINTTKICSQTIIATWGLLAEHPKISGWWRRQCNVRGGSTFRSSLQHR